MSEKNAMMLPPPSEGNPEAVSRSRASIDRKLEQLMRQFVAERITDVEIPEGDALKVLFVKEFENYQSQIGAIEQEGREIFGAIADDPRMVVFFEELMGGAPVKKALIKAELDEYFLDEQQPDDTEYAALIEEKKSNAQRSRLLKESAEARVQENLLEMESFLEAKGVDENTIEEFSCFLLPLVEKIADNRFDAPLMETFWKAFVHDKELEQQYNSGIIQGRNQKIEQQWISRSTNDGLCPPTGTSKQVRTVGYIEKLLGKK